MPNHILALDQGTTSSRAIVYDGDGRQIAQAQHELTQHFPQPGWVEHDPMEIWSGQSGVAMEVMSLANIRRADLAGIGIANQRETTLVWDRRTGEPIHRAIVWQDRRTADVCQRLKKSGAESLVRRKTGLVIDPYFSGTKVAWILDHARGARRRAARGELAFGTVDSWLLWKLTSGAVHATDASNASRTMLFNIHTGQWDEQLLNLLRVPPEVLPQVRPTCGMFGEATEPLAGAPITGIAGDQQAALFGQACFKPGMTKSTYGTGCFLLQNIGRKPATPRHGLLTTIAWQLGDTIEYALEGSIFIGGAIVQWLRDGLGIIRSSAEIEELARSVPDNGGVYLVPALAGLGAPYWDPLARGLLIGLTRGVNRGHIARAALEGIAFQVADLIDAICGHSGAKVKELRVDGGGAANHLLLQFQADLLGLPVVRCETYETTALGAALLAGLGAGLWKNVDTVATRWRSGPRFEPSVRPSAAKAWRARWHEAVQRSRRWELPSGSPP